MIPSKAKYIFDPTLHPYRVVDEDGVVLYSGYDLNTLVDTLAWTIACGTSTVDIVPPEIAHLLKHRLDTIAIIALYCLHPELWFDLNHSMKHHRRSVLDDIPVPEEWLNEKDGWEDRRVWCNRAIADLGYIIHPKDHNADKLYADLFWEVVKDERRLESVNPGTWARAYPVVRNLYYTLMDAYNRACCEPKDPDIEAKGATLARMADLLNIDSDYRPVAPYGKPTKKW